MAAVGVNYGQIADIVRTVYDDTAALKAATASNDSMYWGVPQNASFPYVYFTIVDAVPTYAFNHLDEFHQTVRVSFNCFAKTDSECNTLMNELTEAYAPSATIAGSTNYDVLDHVELTSGMEWVPEEQNWQATVDYEFTLYRKE